MLDEPRVVDLVRGGHVVRDEDDRRQLVDPLADPVRALQLVEQYVTVSSSLGFWISWNARLLELLAIRSCRSRPGAAGGTPARSSARSRGSRALTRSDCLSCSPPKFCVDSTCHASFSPNDSFAVTLKFVLLLRLLDDLGLHTRRVARLGPPRLELVLELLRGARLLGHLAGRVAPDLLRRERDRGDQVADLVVLGHPGLPVGHHDPEVDRSSWRRRRTRSARAASSPAWSAAGTAGWSRRAGSATVVPLSGTSTSGLLLAGSRLRAR